MSDLRWFPFRRGTDGLTWRQRTRDARAYAETGEAACGVSGPYSLPACHCQRVSPPVSRWHRMATGKDTS